ncbi:MAG: U32 family peptidase [Bacilli bacterium]|jgi:putative protease|nr:U32 family peptidase [Bacilli bacterium]
MIELLAPAGNLDRLKIAYLYGADATYIGGYNYSLRANAINFSAEELKEAVEFAHSLNKKVYVTVNIVLHNSDLAGLKEYLLELESIGVDAVIVSDIAVINVIKNNNINLEVHVSTQASTLNYEAALFYKSLGAKRVVLAREATKDDIKIIKDKTGLDLECFIQGAMCTSFSGKCVLSNVATNRDSNRGGCAQICRWTFNINNENDVFSMTPKDLNMAVYLKQMMDIGVNSFKVEGRMRSVYYIATVIYEYRNLFDKIKSNTLTENDILYSNDVINRCANRESVPQFFDGQPTEKEQYYLGRDEVSNQDFLGIVLDSLEDKILIEERNYFKVGDEVEFFGPGIETFSYKIGEILDEKMECIEVARHPRMHVYLRHDKKLPKGTMMRLKVFDKKMYL